MSSADGRKNAAAVSGDAGYAASSGGADDILGREQTQFPDTADETVYSIGFHYVLPAKGTLTSSFGERLSPLTGEPGFHYGVDIAADEGTPIEAFADGTVRETGESSYGKYLIVDHADGFSTLYAHCSSISVEVGEKSAAAARLPVSVRPAMQPVPICIWRSGETARRSTRRIT